MLKIFRNFKELDIGKLLLVYEEAFRLSMQKDDIDRYFAEEKFLFYLREDFFCREHTLMAVWIVADRYVSALRLEPYEDGFLLSGLETEPASRRNGYATCLLQSMIAYAVAESILPIYVHIHRKNAVSRDLHKKYGFFPLYDFGRLIDGTVSSVYDTFIFKK